jgi:hypothetical protein
MAVKLVRKNDPLTGVPGRDLIEQNVATYLDPEAKFGDRSLAYGWLRGAWQVMDRIPKRKTAADYIKSVLKGGQDVQNVG